mgnify:FL=1
MDIYGKVNKNGICIYLMIKKFAMLCFFLIIGTYVVYSLFLTNTKNSITEKNNEKTNLITGNVIASNDAEREIESNNLITGNVVRLPDSVEEVNNESVQEDDIPSSGTRAEFEVAVEIIG